MKKLLAPLVILFTGCSPVHAIRSALFSVPKPLPPAMPCYHITINGMVVASALACCESKDGVHCK